MCEWLSSGEWCDVQILCRGRLFSAHRVVLASVSTFLKNIFLSNSEETQTLIILPDFDVEAVSSVLYYVYHGEAHIKTTNLEKFYEIVKSLQIFVDDFSIPRRMDGRLTPNHDCFLSNDSLREVLHNIKKHCSNEVPKPNPKCSTVYDNLDRQKLLQNWTEVCSDSRRNLQSPNEDRQRNSFLRDSFVPTYRWTGNVNGGADCVLAISNEPYQTPSVPLMNINAKHLGDYRALPEFYRKIFSQQTPRAQTDLKPSKPCEDFQRSCNIQVTQPLDLYKSSPENYTILLQEQKNIGSSSWMNSLNNPITLRETLENHNQSMVLDLRVNTFFNRTEQFSRNESEVQVETINNNNAEIKNQATSGFSKEESILKSVILNKVLDSPWRPRTPNTCKPFRRKLHNISKFQHSKDYVPSNKIVNDNNNNIESAVGEIREKSTETVANAISVSLCTATTTIENDDMKCRICDQMFTSKALQESHMKRHNSSARYTCGECGKSFSQLRNYKYHMSVHRGTREFAATCSICGKYFNDRGYLSSHMKIHRNRKEYKCSVCPKSFNQRVAYNMHVRIHTGVKPHECGECGKAFSRKMLLKQHQRTHSGERPYACSHCDKRFADRSNMTLHLRLHTGVKPFSCSLCSKSFTKKHHLKSHLNFHTGAKPYACPRCNLAFTQSSNMRTHLKKCTIPEPCASNSKLSS